MTDRPESSPILNLPKGKMIDGYRIVELIGRGGMGAVYRATDTRNNIVAPVALKLLYPHLARKSGDFTRRFLREARIASRISHPNLVQIYECSFCDDVGLFYIAQEYIGGGTLRQLIANDTVLTEAGALGIGIGVARALEAAHRRKIIHRDIKPDNIMFTTDGTVKLMDWGIAKNTAPSPLGGEVTVNKVFMGTPVYASPEQLRNARDVDIRADIYSLGATMYYSLVGKPPLRGTTEIDSLSDILTKPAPDVRKARPDVSAKTAAIIKQMLEKMPEARPQTPTILLEALLDAANTLAPGLRNGLDDSTIATAIDVDKQAQPVYAPRTDDYASPPAPAWRESNQAQPPPPAQYAPQAPQPTPSVQPAPQAPPAAQPVPPAQYAPQAPPPAAQPVPPAQYAPQAPQPTPSAQPAPQAPPSTTHDYASAQPTPHTPPPTYDYAPPQPVQPASQAFPPAQPAPQAPPQPAQLRPPVQPPPTSHDYAQPQPVQTPPPAPTIPQPPPTYELQPELAHPNRTVVDTGRRDRSSQQSSAPPASAPSPESAKSGIGLFWKLFMTIALVVVGVVCGWYAHPHISHRLLCRQGKKAIEEKNYALAKECYEKALQIKELDDEPQKLLDTARRGVRFQELIAKAEEYESKSLPDWELILGFYKEASEIEGFKDDEAAIAGITRATNNITYKEKLAEADAAIKKLDWDAAQQALTEIKTIPDVVPNNEITLRRRLVDNEIKYRNLLEKAEKANPETAESHFRQALAAERDEAAWKKLLTNQPFSYQEAADGLANCLIKKAEKLAEDKKFTDAKDTLDEILSPPENANNKVQERLLKHITDDVLTQVKECRQKITDKKASDEIAKAKADFDREISNGATALDGNDLDTAVTHFLKAVDLAKRNEQPKWRKQAEEQLQKTQSKQIDQLCTRADSDLNAQPQRLDSAEKNLLKAKEILPKLHTGQERNQLEAKINNLEQRLRDAQKAIENELRLAKLEELVAGYQSWLKKSEDFLASAKVQGNDAKAKIDRLRHAINSQKQAFKIWEKIREIDQKADPKNRRDIDKRLFTELSELGESRLQRSKEQKVIPNAISFGDCLQAEECFQLITELSDDAPGKSKADEYLKQVKNEEGFLKRLSDALASAKDKDFPNARKHLEGATALPGYGNDPRSAAVQEFIDSLKNNNDYEVAIAEAQRLEEKREWTEAEKQYDIALKVPGRKQDETALARSGRERCQKGPKYDWHLKKAEEYKANKQWTEAVEQLSEADKLKFVDTKMAELSAEIHKDISTNAQTAWTNENWDVAESLVKVAKQIPGYGNDALTRMLYAALCHNADQLFQGGKAVDAKKLFEKAQNLGLEDPKNRASQGIAKCEKALRAANGFAATKDALEQECQALLTGKYIKNLAGTFDFQRYLQDCWDFLEVLPKNQREPKKADLKKMVIEDCLKELSYNLRYDIEVMANTQGVERLRYVQDFLTFLNDCDKITNGAINALDDTHDLCKYISELVAEVQIDLDQVCNGLLTKKYIESLEHPLLNKFRSRLQDCWDFLKVLPQKRHEYEKTKLEQKVIENCLTKMSENLLHDGEVKELPEAKRAFLELLNTCDEITNGAISALDDTQPLCKNISALVAEDQKNLGQACKTLLTKKYIESLDDAVVFRRRLQNCWDFLNGLPENQREPNKTKVKKMVIDDCLTKMSEYLLRDDEVKELPEAKRAFLELLNTCDEITKGAISALDDTHPLRQNVSAFFVHNPQPLLWTPDAANTKIISWLAPLVAKNHQE